MGYSVAVCDTPKGLGVRPPSKVPHQRSSLVIWAKGADGMFTGAQGTGKEQIRCQAPSDLTGAQAAVAVGERGKGCPCASSAESCALEEEPFGLAVRRVGEC